MTRVHVCSEPGCPELANPGRSRCPQHDTPRKAWAHRGQTDNAARAAHARWRRQAIKAQPYCTVCGAREKLDVHHDQAGHPVVVCNMHHMALDKWARPR